ncbi:bL33 family ribosomal protein [Streptantibioticus cattleyicolor]|uniref:Large ribosomal subunit protein bL33 n=1 Tax=Streptantibioticus cattleyicolor (strain ATCC 35852 / DSM 46488 / JCM 4925 / NBRC 14057 / NRRL 8057) TaxID=1003195 RepID=G8XGX6_STREN|nr:hypothetical protein [Streptantibioticus cattleyicolor]AEW98802.1 50S ribosomal protein L33 [Streptantibioticus cattleyicolor NRRL 8057 = DSM 46488]
MARDELRPIIRSTAGTGDHTRVTRNNRRDEPDRLVPRAYAPVAGGHVDSGKER